MTFKNKRVLITGGSRGIGRSIAQAFAREGSRVAFTYQKNASAAKDTLDLLGGPPHCALGADLSDPEMAPYTVEQTLRKLGGLDILIHNAGVYKEHSITKTTYKEWQKAWQNTISINLIGPANLTHCAVEHMRRQGGGRIVSVSSRGAFRGEPDHPAYAASKAGLNAMSQSLAKALAPLGIFIGIVAPGFVETDMTAALLQSSLGKEIRSQSPLNRVATPEDVARAVLFLAQEENEFTTGTIIDVNGASYLRS